MPEYINQGILPEDPFQSIDQDGVGELIKIGIERGRKARKNLEIGICGEHGGEPRSVEFCHRVGMDYVSCSPFRVPIAKLAAAQAVLKENVTVIMPIKQPLLLGAAFGVAAAVFGRLLRRR